MGVNDRFYSDSPGINFLSPVLPLIVYQSAVSVTTGDAETKTVAALTLPARTMAPGTTFRVTMAGTKTGANGTLSAVLSLNGTAVLSIDAAGDTAIDWIATLYLVQVSPKVQRCFGTLATNGVVTASDYATGAVDVSGETVFRAAMANEHASDDLTADVCIIEYWKKAS